LLDSTAKVIAAITALIVAVTGLIAAFGFGGDPGAAGVIVVLDSPQAFETFLANHPSKG
tara:strand:- start:464 stop:640 length:177 start_codon:yes stop_codon:yes gene_type:complete